MECREHSSGNDKYEPGSLLPNPKPYDGPYFDARDYLLDEYYTGTDENGLPNLDDFARMVETGVIAVPNLDQRIEMRGFRERLDRLTIADFEERGLRNGIDLRITSADLWACITWYSTETEYDDGLEEEEQLIANVKEGDTLAVQLSDEEGWVEPVFLNEEGVKLPLSPYHDYDQLEFEKLMPLAEDDWILSCVVTGVEVFGGTSEPAAPDFNWRVCQITTDVYGYPGHLKEEDMLAYELRNEIEMAVRGQMPGSAFPDDEEVN